jgi:hypothetical protein
MILHALLATLMKKYPKESKKSGCSFAKRECKLRVLARLFFAELYARSHQLMEVDFALRASPGK